MHRCPRMLHWSFLLLTQILSTNAHNFTKCCSYDDVLVQNGASFECKPAENTPRINYLTAVTVGFDFHRCAEEEFCVDVLNGTHNFFKVTCGGSSHPLVPPFENRKCCPPRFAYDRSSHGCAPSNAPEIFPSNYLKAGLAECTSDGSAVRDYVVDDLNFDKEGNFHFWEYRGWSHGDGRYCVDKVGDKDKYVVRVCDKQENVCKTGEGDGDGKIVCLRKCCPDGEIYEDRVCSRNYTKVVNFSAAEEVEKSNGDDDFAIIHGITCRKYVAHERVSYSVDKYGNLHVVELGENVSYPPTIEKYCVEYSQNPRPEFTGDLTFLCFYEDKQESNKFEVTRAMMITSCIFILLTIAAYVWLFDVLNLFAKALISFCVSMLVLFLFLILLQFDSDMFSSNQSMCKVFGYLVMGVSFSTFVWMNVMCLDIWCTFGSSRGNMTLQQKQRERKRFIWYSLYGWGVPIFLTLFAFVIEHTKILPAHLTPVVGKTKCMLHNEPGNYGKLLYFVLPITLFKICDIVLFIRTTVYCMKVKNAINKMNDTNAAKVEKKKWFIADKERLGLLIKLFIIMGVSWLFEAVSSIIDFRSNPVLKKIELIWDSINCLQGVLIFVIFVCKRSILASFRKKLGLEKFRRHSFSSCATQSLTIVDNRTVHCKSP